MRLIQRLTLTLIAILSLTACGERREIARELKAFRESTITIPEDLQAIAGGRLMLAGTRQDNSPKFIVYHDSSACSGCKISHLEDLRGLFKLADSLATFKVMVIFSPAQEEYDNVRDAIAVREFDFPVYLDGSASFRHANKAIPDDGRLHAFLIDGYGKPRFVGNPMEGDAMRNLFLEALGKTL